MASESVNESKKTKTATTTKEKATGSAAKKSGSTSVKKTSSKASTTKKKEVKPKTTVNTEKKSTTKKTTAKSATKSSPKTTVKTTPKKTTTVKRKTTTSATPVKKETQEKAVTIAKPEEKKVTNQAPKTSTKINPKIENEHEYEHFGVYAFLLSAVLICLHVMGRYTLEIDNIMIDYSVLLFPSVFFITNVITKKFDCQKSMLAILISSIAMLLFVYLSKYLNTKVVDYFVIYGQLFAYIVSQLINLIIYYYLLVNTELKARWIYLTYVFAIMVNYFVAILFSTRIVMTVTFWPTFFISVVLSSIIAIMYAFYDSFVKRGHE